MAVATPQLVDVDAVELGPAAAGLVDANGTLLHRSADDGVRLDARLVSLVDDRQEHGDERAREAEPKRFAAENSAQID